MNDLEFINDYLDRYKKSLLETDVFQELVKFKKKSMTTNTALRFDTNGIDSLNKYIYEFRDGMVNINTFDCMLHINKNDVTAVTLKSGNPPSRQIKMGLTFL